MVHLKPKATTTLSPESSPPSSAGSPTASALTPHTFGAKIQNQNNNSTNTSTTSIPISPEEEYERNFFLLRVFVLGTIGCVFSTLVLMFWIYFMYLWKTWDSGKRSASANNENMPNPEEVLARDPESQGPQIEPYANEEDSEAENSGENLEPHPHFNRALMRSRRKSVSFAVCKVNADTMQFDIEHKSVLLGNLSASRKPSSRPPASPLREVAKKWRDAKNKLVLKEKISNVILGSSNLDDFEDEASKNRRRELMEKAKALEEAAKSQAKKGSDA